jgi:hypothetical protein
VIDNLTFDESRHLAGGKVVRRVLAVSLSAAFCALFMGATAIPANAAAVSLTNAVCNGGVINQSFSASTNDVVTITSIPASCVKLQVQNRLVTSTSDIVALGSGVGTVSLVGGNYEVTATSFSSIQITLTNTTSNFAVIGLGQDADFGIQRTQWIVNYTGTGGGGGGGGTNSASSASAPVLETLTISATTNDTTCTGGSPTGYTGSWLQLPAADQCSQSGPNANPNAKLLGWATDPIFPVSVAQEIVNLKYGPIDGMFYGMRMIFIPAGGWTYISSSNTLYPIWAS